MPIAYVDSQGGRHDVPVWMELLHRSDWPPGWEGYVLPERLASTQLAEHGDSHDEKSHGRQGPPTAVSDGELE